MRMANEEQVKLFKMVLIVALIMAVGSFIASFIITTLNTLTLLLNIFIFVGQTIIFFIALVFLILSIVYAFDNKDKIFTEVQNVVNEHV